MDVSPQLLQISDCLYRLSAKALIVRDGKVLFVMESEAEGWSLPGGGIDYGEDIQTALARELSEEIGIDRQYFSLSDTVVSVIIGGSIGGVPRANLVYAVELAEGIDAGSGSSSLSIGWFSPAEIARMQTCRGTGSAQQLALIVERAIGNKKQWANSANGRKSNIIRKAAGIIISNQELLVERSIGKDFYIAPGGKIEQGESAEQALVRELEEELDIQIKQSDLRFFGSFHAAAANSPSQTVQMEVFLVSDWQGNIVANESQELQWINSKTAINFPIGSIFLHQVLPKLVKAKLVK